MTAAPSQLRSHATSPRVLVLQVGARLHYGVPAVYARHDALAALFTDATASKGVLRVARAIIPEQLRGATLRRLLGRVLPPDIAPRAVAVETASTLLERAALKLRVRHEALVSTHDRLRRRIQTEGFGEANCFYSVDNGDLPLLRRARSEGLAIIYEQIINPTVGRMLDEERALHPGIEPRDSSSLIEEGIARDIEVFRLADAVVCASHFVRDDIRALSGIEHAVHVVPYGLDESWLSRVPSPVRGRVLCVGTVGLRKGTHYLAEATRLLQRRGVDCDVRVVGPYDRHVLSHPAFQGPTYLGQVPRSEVQQHFATADVFVLPTLSEGFALVHLEALALGLPVITTAHCGSAVRDGVDGFIVPIRSASALAERIEQLISDRELRQRMSMAARERAREFTWARFGEQLMTATRAALAHRRGAR